MNQCCVTNNEELLFSNLGNEKKYLANDFRSYTSFFKQKENLANNFEIIENACNFVLDLLKPQNCQA